MSYSLKLDIQFFLELSKEHVPKIYQKDRQSNLISITFIRFTVSGVTNLYHLS